MANNNITPEIYEPSLSSWKDIEKDVCDIERQAFGEKGFSAQELQDDFLNPENVVVLLRRRDENQDQDAGSVIGFTYVKPESTDTVFVWDTVIAKEYRKHKLVGSMMNLLEQELRKRGYVYIEREAMVAHHYAENIEKHYKERIVEKGTPHDSVWGEQIFFRIRI